MALKVGCLVNVVNLGVRHDHRCVRRRAAAPLII